MPAISVVVVSHNQGRFVEEALTSVQGQTRQPDEIGLVDDASEDGSWNVMSSFASGRPDVFTIRHDQRRGASETFNDAIAQAQGEYIVLLAADDRLSPNYLEAMEQALEANRWDFGYSDSHCFGDRTDVLRFPEFDRRRLARSNFINASAMFRKDLSVRIGGWDPSFDPVGYDDWDFWMRASVAGARGGKVHGCHLEWRRHAGNRTSAQTTVDLLRARWLILRKHGWQVRIWMIVGLAIHAVERSSRPLKRWVSPRTR